MKGTSFMLIQQNRRAPCPILTHPTQRGLQTLNETLNKNLKTQNRKEQILQQNQKDRKTILKINEAKIVKRDV